MLEGREGRKSPQHRNCWVSKGRQVIREGGLEIRCDDGCSSRVLCS